MRILLATAVALSVFVPCALRAQQGQSQVQVPARAVEAAAAVQRQVRVKQQPVAARSERVALPVVKPTAKKTVDRPKPEN